MGDIKQMPPKDYLFKKGQSGNPKGRPKKERPSEAYDSALDRLIPKSLTVIEMSLDESIKTKKVTRDTLTNAHKILDRAYGTPTQKVETTIEKIDYSKFSVEELERMTKDACEKVEELKKQA